MAQRFKIAALLLIVGLVAVAAGTKRVSGQQNPPAKKDPAAWGSNHVGKPVPEYLSGDECLFCHRNDIGPLWSKSSHGATVRPRDDSPFLEGVLKSQRELAPIADQVEFFLGSRHRVRFLKKEGYNKFAILDAQAVLATPDKFEKLVDGGKLSWNKDKFSNQCAGCHTTGVDTATKSFSASGLDCYTCHGVVDLKHTGNTELIILSKKRRGDALVITSICASCHLRGGSSRSTKLPYPNNFVAGDNLFQDFDVDWSKADDQTLNPGDRHVYRNVRDVVIEGSDFPTCISCHDVHKDTTEKHRRAPRTAICSDCHQAEGTIKGSKRYTVQSALCEY
jgi:predicted CXXCH cytochrome family protein